MSEENDTEKSFRCSFCGLHENRSDFIIGGPGVFICYDCVAVCSQVVQDSINTGSQISAACKICGTLGDINELTRLDSLGHFCSECVSQLREKLGKVDE